MATTLDDEIKQIIENISDEHSDTDKITPDVEATTAVITELPKFPVLQFPITHAGWLQIYTHIYTLTTSAGINCSLIMSPKFLISMLEWINNQIDTFISLHYGNTGEIHILDHLDWADCIALALTCKNGAKILKSIGVFKNTLLKYNISKPWALTRQILFNHRLLPTEKAHIYELVKKIKDCYPYNYKFNT